MNEVRPRVASNFLALVIGDVVARVAAFLVLAYVARRLGAEPLGWLAIGQLAAFLAPAVVDWGFSTVLVRSVVLGELTPGDALARSWGIRLLVAAGWLAGSVVVVWTVPLARDTAAIVLAFTPFAVSLALDPALVYQAAQRMWPLVIVRSAAVVCYAILAILAVSGWRSVVPVAVSLTATHLVGTMVGIAILGRMGVRPPWPTLRGWGSVVRAASPIGVAALASTAMLNIGILAVALSRSAADVGQYNAALRIFVVLVAPTSFFAIAALPRMTAAWRSGATELGEYADRAARLLGALALPATTLGVLFARPAIVAVYGPGFDDAVTIFRVLVVGLAVAFVGAMLQPAAIAAGRERAYVAVLAVAAASTLLVSIGLAVPFGGAGVAFAFVLGHALTVTLLLWFLRGVIRPALVIRYAWPNVLPAAAAGVAAAFVLGVAPWPVAFVTALLVLAAASMATGSVAIGDLRLLRPRR